MRRHQRAQQKVKDAVDEEREIEGFFDLMSHRTSYLSMSRSGIFTCRRKLTQRVSWNVWGVAAKFSSEVDDRGGFIYP